jgi:hypothetical protein
MVIDPESEVWPVQLLLRTESMFGRADADVEALSGSVRSVGGAPISKRDGGQG